MLQVITGIRMERTISLSLVRSLAIPQSAMLWPGGTPRVFVRRAPDTYELREVKLGRSGDALREVLGGAKEGEQVVTSAGVLLDGHAHMNSDANP
jgi:Cu(I)/Ag(I) efflux system membrane fusion protein